MKNYIVNLREEWDNKVFSTNDRFKQVGRILDCKNFSLLVKDINDRLLLSKSRTNQKLENLLDIGCGNALLTSSFVDNFEYIYGCDFSENMIQEAKTIMPSGNFSVCQANAISFDVRFDRILCYSIFHYFPNTQYASDVIIRMIEHCKKGGIILIGDVPNLKNKDILFKTFDPEYAKTISFIDRHDSWLFYDVNMFIEIADSFDCKVEILQQNLPIFSSQYRCDILIYC